MRVTSLWTIISMLILACTRKVDRRISILHSHALCTVCAMSSDDVRALRGRVPREILQEALSEAFGLHFDRQTFLQRASPWP